MTIKRIGSGVPSGMEYVIHREIQRAWIHAYDTSWKRYKTNSIPEPVPLYDDIILYMYDNFKETAEKLYKDMVNRGDVVNAFEDIFREYVSFGRLLEDVHKFLEFHRFPVLMPVENRDGEIIGYHTRNSPQVEVFEDPNVHSVMVHGGM